MREPSPHKQLFWEYQGQLAVREGDWKLVLNGKLDFDRVVPDQVHLSDLSRIPGALQPGGPLPGDRGTA